jgi:hypothetical protein
MVPSVRITIVCTMITSKGEGGMRRKGEGEERQLEGRDKERENKQVDEGAGDFLRQEGCDKGV